jgi:hypothetical protein
MTLLDFEELIKYWNRHPPPHLLLAAYLEATKPCGASAGARSVEPIAFPQPDDATMLAASLGPGFSAHDVHSGLPPTILDFRELKKCNAG